MESKFSSVAVAPADAFVDNFVVDVFVAVVAVAAAAAVVAAGAADAAVILSTMDVVVVMTSDFSVVSGSGSNSGPKVIKKIINK